MKLTIKKVDFINPVLLIIIELVTLYNIIEFIGTNKYKLKDKNTLKITGFKPITSAKKGEISFYSHSREKAIEVITSSNASVIICDKKIESSIKNLNSNFIFVDNPRLWFFRCVNKFSIIKDLKGIKSTAIIESKINEENIFVGHHTFIGKNVKIGKNTKIYSNVTIYDNTSIGKNVIINSGAVIGSRGFGYEINENENVETFHHLGGVKIFDDVEIGANVCIDRGSLEDTVIGERTIIDNLVHISHNVKIGKDCQIVALTMVGGSVIIENNVKIAMSSTLRDNIRIGEKAVVGLGAVVTKDVKNKTTVYGNPAKIRK